MIDVDKALNTLVPMRPEKQLSYPAYLELFRQHPEMFYQKNHNALKHFVMF